MIISLFMETTPVSVTAAGHATSSAHARRAGGKAGALRDREHEEEDGHRDALELCEEPLNWPSNGE
jgi:hypothetical protein